MPDNAPTQQKELLMPVSESTALAHTEIIVLRQISENISTVARHLEALKGSVDDVRERVIKLEAAELKKSMEKLEARIREVEEEKADAVSAARLDARVKELESERDRAKGEWSIFGWASKNAPWLITLAVAAAAFFRK